MSIPLAPSLDQQIATLRWIVESDWQGPPMRRSEIAARRADLEATIKTLLAEKERRLSPQEALARLVP